MLQCDFTNCREHLKRNACNAVAYRTRRPVGVREHVDQVADTGHKALCPVSRYVDRAYLWAPALGSGHTCGSWRLGLGIPVCVL